ncbi:hypothetical protein M3643_12995, partial [Staphylococcus lugdunensis]|nr:hypothetical protein [Staphylococcus lugdunensis]
MSDGTSQRALFARIFVDVEINSIGELHVALAPTDRQHTFASTRSVRCITRRRTPQHVETSAAASGAR